MKAVVHVGRPGLAGLTVQDIDTPTPGDTEVLVRVRSAALNHRDLFVFEARQPDAGPFVPGSDGAGVVAAVGSAVDGVAPGDEVIIDPTLGWRSRAEVPEVPEILGGPTNGTFAEFVTVPAENVVAKPSHLDWAEAAALPLSGVTAYRALFTRGGLRAGEHVLLPGIGSGVATIALAMAKAAGARVSVTSRGQDKLDRALGLGADHAVSSSGDWRELLPEPVDLVVDSVGSATFDACLRVLRPGGRLVSLGATTGPDVTLSLRELFFRQISLLGTSMGSAEDFHDMVAFVAEHRLRPVVHRAVPLAEGPAALAALAGGEQFGKLVLTVSAA
ncbi:zinc-binding dehydrogenase [Goodfellowiella coeruleoviolacea]|uniref:Zinc-binding alcohol dehydrogenase/oxidoreductase n=1 Tax=Goodfellowiella coeruleoviolacea TaxID=334858 RepID=A0AAE3KE64_9PSEU|nr:zinc-binding dehydrogenase [Goodfellowiella coeruleoviolacea]MCP2163520.1 zinc-binding alcohol dehydrogenase/oxidoreductase [Goodfellowiella coeruleoviolacea]